MKPDVLIVGDSHSRALNEGCKALGLSTRLVIFSGRNWATGAIMPHKTHGLWMKRPWAQKMLIELKEELGVENLARTDVPVLFSVGYHLGRMVPPFGWNSHIVAEENAAISDEHLAVSSGFLAEYVRAYRRPHFSMIEQFARTANLTVVAPPPLFERLNYSAFRSEISRQITGLNAVLYDPAHDLADETGLLPETLWEVDQTHGNAEYGRLVIKALIERGRLPSQGGAMTEAAAG